MFVLYTSLFFFLLQMLTVYGWCGVCCVEMEDCAVEIARIYSTAAPAVQKGSKPEEIFFPPLLKWYSDGFTRTSKEQMARCKALTENPAWSERDRSKIEEYYKLHKECQLDQNLSYIASTLGVIIHGNIDQVQLAGHLKRFNINKLLESGPYENPTLSHEAQVLIYEALHGMPYVYDVHLHNLGYDEGNYVSPKIASQAFAPWGDYFTFMALRYAAGMRDPVGSTHEARKRIHLYAGHFPKLCGYLLPIHGVIRQGGKFDVENTGNYLCDDSARLTALSFNCGGSELLPAASIHPFELKWREKLKNAHERGIRLIKWMPPQGICPDSVLLDAYYLQMASYGMTLIAHAGHQHALPTNEENRIWEDSGNPLRFRRALMLGVNVILAHSGHKDPLPDLDNPENGPMAGYELFLRLAREAHKKRWKGVCYGDLAAVTTHYGPEIVKALLAACCEDGVHLVYGSDYPYTNLIRPSHDAYEEMSGAGLLDPTLVSPLKEIREWNPLLANYVFTRNLELTTESGQKMRFPETCFTGQFRNAPLKLIDRSSWKFFKNSS